MKMKPVAQVCMWLPGFDPDEDPCEVLGTLNSSTVAAHEIIKEVQPKPLWPQLEASHHDSVCTAVPKYEANVAAIKLLRQLEAKHMAHHQGPFTTFVCAITPALALPDWRYQAGP